MGDNRIKQIEKMINNNKEKLKYIKDIKRREIEEWKLKINEMRLKIERLKK